MFLNISDCLLTFFHILFEKEIILINYAGDTPVAIFADRRYRRIKSPISGMSDFGDEIRRYSPSVPVPAIFTLIAANRH